MSSIRTLVGELHTWEWLAILLARLAVGLLFFLSGRGKLFVPERREEMRKILVAAHIPFPELNTLFVSTVRLRLPSYPRRTHALSPAWCLEA
jgi:putative oxidoreductase